VQGALELIAELARWLMLMTGMDAVAMSPRAGVHGEACGMMAIKAAIAAKGEDETRKTVLVPESAHGTNPASAAGAGFEVRPLTFLDDGS
jgi:glycine cleavage system P protein (glycine dehydrogenase) subunit 2